MRGASGLTFCPAVHHAPGVLSQRRLGITYALIAHGIWGVLPLYLKALHAVTPFEVVAHRIVWSATLLVLVVTVVHQRTYIAQLRARPRIIATSMASALALSINWLIYIWAVAEGRVIDASLGYFINPLVSVVLGVVVLKERLRALQWVAVAVATTGVLWLALLVGQWPWIGLSLAVSFGTYGLLRKTASIDALGGLTLETLLLLPLAALYLIKLSLGGHGSWAVAPISLRTLLIAAGPITAVPLLCFAAAARRIPLSLLGILQYLGPSLQLGLGVFVFHEHLPIGKLAGFALIWLALVLYATEGAVFNARLRANAIPP
jgi:chloramphenicol-sensitive protein RarD